MSVNGEAIYGTHPIRPYAAPNICLTQSKDSLNTYVFYLSEPNNADVTLPAGIAIDRFTPAAKSKITILGTKTALKWREDNKKLIISIPPDLQNKPVGRHAVVFRITT
jgi:alpha-L-fucosidase